MKVTMVGAGYVGLVTGTCFSEIGHEVVCVDIDERKIERLNSGGVPIFEPGLEEMLERCRSGGRIRFTTSIAEGMKDSEVIFIAVNTPPLPDGSADLRYVESCAREVAENLDSYRLIVEKSTVPVRTGRQVAKTIRLYAPKDADFDVASNPEFLREGSAIGDFMKPDRIVIGVESKRAEQYLRKLYEPIDAPLIVADIESAELIKHASNSFLATKISFMNAVAAICEEVGADVDLVAQGMGLDARIGRAFLNAGVGYGGSCFPKDVSAFIRMAEEVGVDFRLLKSVEEINMEARNRIVRKLKRAVWVLKGKRIAVWGLAFKPNTDDMRNAPSIDIISELIEEGAEIAAYDPVAAETAREVLPPDVHYASSPREAAEGAEALLILTEWDEITSIPPGDIREWLRHPIVVDGRNIHRPSEMEALGFTYISVGRPAVRA